jgi:conjugal transfer pilus assembly protein TraD
VIVIDPKGDGELRALLAAECRAVGRGADFAYFHPAFPSHSVRLDGLRNWARTTEVASRIAALIPSESGNDPFSAFAWRVINLICEGLIHGLNERPSLLSIRRYVEGGPDDLVRRSIERVLAARGLDPARALQPYLRRLPAREKPSATTPDELMALVALY